MDLKNPLLLLCIGLLLGIVVAEAFYYVSDPVVLRDGAVEVLVDQDYYSQVSSLLSNAQDSIHMVMFSVNYQTDPKYRDSHVNELLQQLVSARNHGVDVQVLMDDWPEGNERALRYLTKNNVPTSLIHLDGSTHAKLIIIDGRIVIVGSTNWSYHSIDKNHEANVIINDERIVREFEEYFQSINT